MKVSLYDLAYEYIKRLHKSGRKVTTDEKKAVLQQIAAALDNGWTAEDILAVIEEGTDLENAFTEREEKRNLLQQGRFYLHNELRVTPPPPVREYDIATGKIKSYSEPYFLEMRASYTVEDLLQYAKKRLPVSNMARWRGGLRWIAERYDIDLILFAVDEMAADLEEKEYRGEIRPFDLLDYLDEARKTMEAKITEEREAGVDRVVPRQRKRL